MSTSEIAKLESRWRENRQGLSFAPLAEAYRKMGEPARALEVLAEGLAVNPNYIPASIVLGRCHLDLGNDPGAEAAFAHVLDLDGENVIALRALADIAERQGRIEDARSRLESLLGVDRGNEDARAQLARLASSETAADAGQTSEAPPAPVAYSGELVEDAAHEPVSAEPWDDEPEAPEPAVDDEAPAAAEPAEAAAADSNSEQQEADAPDDWIPEPEPFTPEPVEPDASIQLQENLTPAEAIAPLDDLVMDDAPAISDASADAELMDGLVGQDFDEHSAGVVPLDDLKTGVENLTEFDDLERAAEVELTPSDTNEFQVADAARELAADFTGDEAGVDAFPRPDESEEFPPLATDEGADMQLESVTAEFETVAASYGADALESEIVGQELPVEEEAPPPPVQAAPSAVDADDETDDDWDDEEEDAGGPPELVVTESMADLYLRQGHRQEALAVYRLLYQRSPDDLRLRERVDELETELAADAAGDTAAEVVSLAADAQGDTVAALFRRVLGAGLPASTNDWHAPAPQAPRALEASAEQGDQSDGAPTRPAGDHLSLSDVFGDEGSPVPPAVPAARGEAEDDVSFDAFFGDAGGEQARSRTSGREDDDLDQFHSWLQNLKR